MYPDTHIYIGSGQTMLIVVLAKHPCTVDTLYENMPEFFLNQDTV